MNADDIHNMPAGGDMDELIVTKIMGFEDLWPNKPRFQKPGKEMFGAVVCYEVPRYSTDIAAAWEVVEKLRRPGWLWAIEESRKDKPPWAAIFYDDAFDNVYLGEADTLPLAICRVALLMVST